MHPSLVSTICYWLSERLRDLAMWPVNLVRDFPVRIGRLLATLWQGIVAIGTIFPQALFVARQGHLTLWFRQIPGRFFFWLHLLLAHLFDLLGGPEIAQFVTHLITHTTPLTADEITHIASVLGPTAMRFGEVRVAEGGLLDLVFKINGNLAYSTWHTIHFSRFGRHTRAHLPILIHELAHVYQYECVGSRYLGEAIYVLIKTKRDCYTYGDKKGLTEAFQKGKHFCDYNREQQAQIIQDYFTSKWHCTDTTAYAPFISEAKTRKI